MWEYLVSILVDTKDIKLPKIEKRIGIDGGLKKFLICSDRYKVDNSNHLRNVEKRSRRLRRDLSRMQNGSNNRNKVRLKVTKLHQKIPNSKKKLLI